ncbi:hypothetical protein [Billgrantia gudaonensis]|uniref:Uncharacterized protein n=1 Tax=Billgrantia gudaonensis TaxID=376427 RepID=A0A1G8R249_9GAMM|nr:hypothetical protein [Halomonas gudaonensis]SDJ10923.1 hypothetical protein SAMN04487954_10365 [Halomonas gudaonensis]
MSDENDTFEGLQRELDDLLGRLTRCMERQQREEQLSSREGVTREEAGQAVYCYAAHCDWKPVERDLASAASLVSFAQEIYRRRLARQVENHGDGKGPLLAALEALAGWPEFAPVPLTDAHMVELMMAAASLEERSSEYFGQNAGLELNPKRPLDRRRLARRMAAVEVFQRNRRDPKAHPIGMGLFERVGKRYGMSGSTVRDAYYSRETKSWQELERHLQETDETL